jgi:hypothetical protein
MQAPAIKGDPLRFKQYLADLLITTGHTLEKNVSEFANMPNEFPIWLISSIKGSVQLLEYQDDVSLSLLNMQLSKARSNKDRLDRDTMLGDAVEIFIHTKLHSQIKSSKLSNVGHHFELRASL